MPEIIEMLKVTGPAIAVLVWLVLQLWKEIGEKEKKINEMFERLLREVKGNSLTNVRMLAAQIKGGTEAIAESYLGFLSKQADDLQKEIEEMKAK